MTHVVVTTINSPTLAVREIASGARRLGWRFIVIGDGKTPADFAVEGASYLDLAAQRDSGLKLAAVAPTGHYARKNVGYLSAIGDGAEAILETDDDNVPLETFWAERSSVRSAPTIEAGDWVNTYAYFTDQPIWPRGLPLDQVRAPTVPIEDLPPRTLTCPVQQGLADQDPDVDAIYRLILPLPITFRKQGAVITAGRSWCPFNSQNTWWSPEAFPLMYLPFYCSWRVTDIWRSFVVQRVFMANGWGLAFDAPTVYQDRNEHDLMVDFAEEVVGYINNSMIKKRLEDLNLTGGRENVLADMMRCYEELIRLELLGSEERATLAAWRSDLESSA